MNDEYVDLIDAEDYNPVPMGVEECTFRVERISSGKGLPQIDWPALPVPVGSPVWTMKPLMFL
jgi:hypothetical protein